MALKRAAKVANEEYEDSKVITSEVAEQPSASGKSGVKPGDIAAKTLWVDDAGKVTDKAPERGSLLVGAGQMIDYATADKIAGK